MANEADYGLMIWDNKSRGTLRNIEKMKKNNKRFFVILNNLIVDEKHIDQFLNLKDLHKKVEQINLF